jgi:putative endonuclease
MTPVPYYCYLLECADGTTYCGVTPDVAKRLDLHNAGKAAKYTSSVRKRPVKLIHVEEFSGVGPALRRERAIKKLSRKAKLRLAGRQ